MEKETKPEMTAEEFLRCWIEDKEDITLAQQHLRSVIRGETSELLKQNEELREALKNIANPIAYMESRLQEGERLNGMMALQLGNSPEYLKGIAEQALKKSERWKSR